MSEELKPCPFCGGDAEYFDHSEHHNGEWHEVACINQECTYLIAQKRTKDAAISAWNSRHIPEGYALVPVEPTDYMLSQGEIRHWQVERDMHSPTPTEMYSSGLESMEHAYRAMIAAAQESDK